MSDRINRVTVVPVSVPYTHREISSRVQRDGVSAILVRVETDSGMVAWGESCVGGDAESVAAAVRAMVPFVISREPWELGVIRSEVFREGAWQFRPGTGSFAFAGIDMALWDLCGRLAGQPVHRLLGGALVPSVNYFYYLSRGLDLPEQCRQGLEAGYSVFYLKVGLGEEEDIEAVESVRSALGPEPLLRLDANGAWSLPEARRMIAKLASSGIDFVEQPVHQEPIDSLRELRATSPIAVAANEGLWSEPQAYDRIRKRQADVFCFSTYWVGGLMAFCRLANVANLEGLRVCKHTHGELGLAAAAGQQALLSIPNGSAGHQQTAAMLAGDILSTALPIADRPDWAISDEPGLGVHVDEGAVEEAAARYQADGPYRPFQICDGQAQVSRRPVVTVGRRGS